MTKRTNNNCNNCGCFWSIPSRVAFGGRQPNDANKKPKMPTELRLTNKLRNGTFERGTVVSGFKLSLVIVLGIRSVSFYAELGSLRRK